MRPTTTTALAIAGTAMALPAGVALADTVGPPSPSRTALAAPFAGHLSANAYMRAEAREAKVERLIPRIVRVERRTAGVKDDRFSERAEERRLEGRKPRELRTELRQSRRELRRARAAAAAAQAAPAAATAASTATPGANTTAAPHLEAIAACESGGDPSAVGGGGMYRGKYQFSQSTWQSVGGTGDPAAASEAEQDARAAQLYAQSGSTPWPVCGG